MDARHAVGGVAGLAGLADALQQRRIGLRPAAGQRRGTALPRELVGLRMKRPNRNLLAVVPLPDRDAVVAADFGRGFTGCEAASAVDAGWREPVTCHRAPFSGCAAHSDSG